MRAGLVALAVVGAGLAAAPAWSATYSIMGIGSESCGSWTQNRESNQALQDEGWVLGFITGLGFASAGTVPAIVTTDGNGVFGWLDNYCKANPTTDLVTASAAFWDSPGVISHSAPAPSPQP
jgi:hypothetical protein